MLSKTKYKVLAVLPEGSNRVQSSLLKALQVDIVRTPAHAQPDHPHSPERMAHTLALETPHSVVIDEFIPDAYNEILDDIFAQVPNVARILVSEGSARSVALMQEQVLLRSPDCQVGEEVFSLQGLEYCDRVFIPPGNTSRCISYCTFVDDEMGIIMR